MEGNQKRPVRAGILIAFFIWLSYSAGIAQMREQEGAVC